MPVTLRGEETFSDSLRWVELAKETKVRLPLWRMPITTGGMRRFLKKINVPVEDYLAKNNERTLKVFGQNNPDWPLRAWCGLQLEDLNWKPFEGKASYQEEEENVRTSTTGNTVNVTPESTSRTAELSTGSAPAARPRRVSRKS